MMLMTRIPIAPTESVAVTVSTNVVVSVGEPIPASAVTIPVIESMLIPAIVGLKA